MSTLDSPATRPPTTEIATDDAWRPLLRTSAAVVAATAVAMQAAGRFLGPSFAILAVVCLAGVVLPPRRQRGAAWAIGVVNVLSLLLHGPMVVAALVHPEVLLAAILSVTNTVASILAIVAAVALLRGRQGASPVPRRLAAAALVGCTLFTVASAVAYATRHSVVPAADEAVLVHEGLSVASTTVEVDGQRATLVVRNDDPLYVRSFDIDALDVHEFIAPRTAVRITLPAEPATYEFYDFLTLTSATEGTIEVR